MADKETLEIFQAGASHEGPLPALLYFALSGAESLQLDPINQPVQFLDNLPIRIFSFTLPRHGEGLSPDQAIRALKQDIIDGNDPIAPFIEKCKATIDILFEKNLIDPTRFAAAGLSRGALIAGRLAAEDDRVTHVLGWAPLIDFAELTKGEFIPHYTLFDSIEQLVGKPLKFLIGNHDERVGTDTAYTFIRQLTLASIAAGIRSPEVELAVKPSIGYKGHGTLPETFKEGADWLKHKFRLI